MDAKTVRTQRIRAWVASVGGPSAFAARLGDRWSATQVSQWISESNPKSIGHTLARDLEQAGGMPRGYLDGLDEPPRYDVVSTEPAAHPARLNPDTISFALAIIWHELQYQGIKFDPDGEVPLFVVAYDYVADASLENRAAFDRAVADRVSRHGGSNGNKTATNHR
jgi:hypothetical protein